MKQILLQISHLQLYASNCSVLILESLVTDAVPNMVLFAGSSIIFLAGQGLKLYFNYKNRQEDLAQKKRLNELEIQRNQKG